MRTALQLISAIALGLTIVPSVLLLTNSVDLVQMKWLMLLGTVAWFIATPLWMGHKTEAAV